MLKGDERFYPEALERGEIIFGSDYEVVLRNIINSRNYLGRRFRKVKPFFKFYEEYENSKGKGENGEIDILAFGNGILTGIEIKTNGMGELPKQARTFYDKAGELYRNLEPEMFCLSGKKGLYLLNLDTDKEKRLMARLII